MDSRRPLLATTTAVAACLALGACEAEGPATSGPPATASSAPASPSPRGSTVMQGPEQRFEQLEREAGARLGLYAVDSASGRVVEHRADERFAHASTTKALTAAAVLDATDDVGLDAVVPIEPGAVVEYSPVTGELAGRGISLRDAAEAAVTVSDNTAHNLLLDHLGGPEGLRVALRAVGDDATEPARYETGLNDVAPGDVRDTSTPRALATSLGAFAVGGELDESDRAQLVAWMRASTTGGELVRAGVPDGWQVGDKSGTPARYGGLNDIALVWPPGAAQDQPWVVAVLTDRPDAGVDAEPDPDLVARATAVAVEALAG